MQLAFCSTCLWPRRPSPGKSNCTKPSDSLIPTSSDFLKSWIEGQAAPVVVWGVRHSCKGRGRALDVGHVGRVLMGWRAAGMVIWLLGEARGLSGWAGLQTYVQLIMSKLSNWRPCSSLLKTGGRGWRRCRGLTSSNLWQGARPPSNRPLPCHLFAPRPALTRTPSSPRQHLVPCHPPGFKRFLTFFYGFPPDKFWAAHNGGGVVSSSETGDTFSLDRRAERTQRRHTPSGGVSQGETFTGTEKFHPPDKKPGGEQTG